jgi:peroxin-11B
MCFPQVNAIKFITLKPETSQKVQKISNRFWLAGILFSITHAVLKVSFRHVLHVLSWYQLIVVGAKAGRLTKEAREIRGLDEKNIGEENARKSQLRALQT